MDTGLLLWAERPWVRSKVYPGDIAGTLHHSGYVQVHCGGALFMGHRLIWKRQTGVDPVDEIDHFNGVRSDNRWGNLREATKSQQNTNRITPNYHRGVHFIPRMNKYGAQIKANGAHLWLGCFDVPEDACLAYRIKARELHQDFARAGRCSCPSLS